MGYAKATAPFLPLLRKNVPFCWTTEHDKAWKPLKEAILKHATLHCMRPDDKLTLVTDVSDYAMGFCLLPTPDGIPLILQTG